MLKELFKKHFPKSKIKKSVNWWIGTDSSTIQEYLEALNKSTNDYSIDDFSLAVCSCSSQDFLIEFDGEEGVAKRTCVKCSKEHFVCDSQEFWEKASSKKWKCVKCGLNEANLGGGFSLYETGDVRRIYLGIRCTKCGVLGCIADWKIGYGPSNQLTKLV